MAVELDHRSRSVQQTQSVARLTRYVIHPVVVVSMVSVLSAMRHALLATKTPALNARNSHTAEVLASQFIPAQQDTRKMVLYAIPTVPLDTMV